MLTDKVLTDLITFGTAILQNDIRIDPFKFYKQEIMTMPKYEDFKVGQVWQMRNGDTTTIISTTTKKTIDDNFPITTGCGGHSRTGGFHTNLTTEHEKDLVKLIKDVEAPWIKGDKSKRFDFKVGQKYAYRNGGSCEIVSVNDNEYLGFPIKTEGRDHYSLDGIWQGGSNTGFDISHLIEDVKSEEPKIKRFNFKVGQKYRRKDGQIITLVALKSTDSDYILDNLGYQYCISLGNGSFSHSKHNYENFSGDLVALVEDVKEEKKDPLKKFKLRIGDVYKCRDGTETEIIREVSRTYPSAPTWFKSYDGWNYEEHTDGFVYSTGTNHPKDLIYFIRNNYTVTATDLVSRSLYNSFDPGTIVKTPHPVDYYGLYSGARGSGRSILDESYAVDTTTTTKGKGLSLFNPFKKKEAVKKEYRPCKLSKKDQLLLTM